MRSVGLLLAAGTLAAAAALVAWLWARGRRAARDAALARLANALPEALGDALLVVAPDGRIVDANDAAVTLAGGPLLGRDLSCLGPDLPVLARGLAHGPAAARVCLTVRGGQLRARAALVRAAHRPPRDVVVLRPEPAPRPPPLPARPAEPLAGAPAPDAADARAVVAAVAATIRDPLARAARAASLLRLSAPAVAAAGRAAGALAELEAALAEAERRAAALAAAGQAGARRAVDVAALVEDLAGALAPPAGVALRVRSGEARAHADDRALRAALREVLRCAVASLPAGGEVWVTVRGGGSAPHVEIALGAAAPAAVAALARALLAPQGVRVEEEARRSGGAIVRAMLPPVPSPASPASATATRGEGEPLAPA